MFGFERLDQDQTNFSVWFLLKEPLKNGATVPTNCVIGSFRPSSLILASESPNGCTFIAPVGTCDFSCPAKAYYLEEEAASEINLQDIAYRRSCGKNWGRCACKFRALWLTNPIQNRNAYYLVSCSRAICEICDLNQS